MSQETEQKILDLLREIRDGQREALNAMEEHRSLVKEQIRISRSNVEESVNLQRLALQRQKVVTLIAVPGIIACIAA
ncbi:MAG: hypothetical protein R3286_05515, partial [Gammaproteobacteria bacterium]|nr:hypothetical protein [Gammaproteobacteria bacterium]